VTDDELKVTDKRMFTPDGELRDEFQHLEKGAAEEPVARQVVDVEEPATDGEEPSADPEEPAADPEATPPETEASSASQPEPGRGRVEIPFEETDGGELGFFDLVGLVAQPVAIYLGDAKLPDGESAENLDMARLHIDLLEVLKNKTAGNLTAQEHTLLEDLLYQLRLRYVQKRG
jgi:hypothetical protein